jgi:DNA-binding NarL/FixJ family response regulator
MSIKVVVVDDHEIVRRGLVCLFRHSEIEVVGEAANGEEAAEQIRLHHPDVVLLDVRMPGGDGLSSMEEIRQELPAVRFVVFTAYNNITYVARSIALGASDFLLKNASKEQILVSVRCAVQGQQPAESSLFCQVRQIMRRRHFGRLDGTALTDRQMQVLRLVALGLSNREIGRSLEISIETVKEHVQNMLRKLDVHDRTQAAVWALRRGIV